MSTRVTAKLLGEWCDYINTKLGYDKDDSPIRFCMYYAYGQQGVYIYYKKDGGARRVFGLASKKECLAFLEAFYKGLMLGMTGNLSFI